jgi:hypothetical protein
MSGTNDVLSSSRARPQLPACMTGSTLQRAGPGFQEHCPSSRAETVLLVRNPGWMFMDIEDFERWRWLEWSVEHASAWALSDDELLEKLDVGLQGEAREQVLREIERRLTVWPAARQHALARVLSRLEQAHRAPGRLTQDADRLLHRLLGTVTGKDASSLAAVCAHSGRLQRRRAAWRFYRGHQIDPALATHLAEEADRLPHPDLVRLVASDAAILSQLDVPRLLSRVPQFYWRGRIVQTLLGARYDVDVRLLSGDYPGEVIFAVRRAGRPDLLPLVRELADIHPRDPDVLNSAIQTFGILGETQEMLRLTEAGRQLLRHRQHARHQQQPA